MQKLDTVLNDNNILSDGPGRMQGTCITLNFASSELKGAEFVEITIDGKRKMVVNLRDTA